MQPTQFSASPFLILFTFVLLVDQSDAQQDFRRLPAKPVPQSADFSPLLPGQPTAAMSGTSYNLTDPSLQQGPSEPKSSAFDQNDLRSSLQSRLPEAPLENGVPKHVMGDDHRDLAPIARGLSQREDQMGQPAIFHQSVQPATYLSQPAPANPQSFARGLLDELAIENAEMEVLGQPISLLDTLSSSHQTRRSELIVQYWRTYQAWAEFRFAVDEVQWLQQLGQPRNEIDRLTLEAAVSAAENSVTAKQLELSRQQGELNEFLLRPPSEMLPLPSDMPLVGRYRTNFEIYSASAPMPERLRMIHQWLPKQQSLIEDRAVTVMRCRNAVLSASQAFKQGILRIGSMLQTIELCRLEHNRFIGSVVDYNQQIAKYALSVKPNQTRPDRVVAMLIPVAPNALDRSALPIAREARIDNPYGSLPRQPSSFTPNHAAPQTDRSLPLFQPSALPQSPATQQPPSLESGFDRGNNRSQFQPAGGNSPFRR